MFAAGSSNLFNKFGAHVLHSVDLAGNDVNDDYVEEMLERHCASQAQLFLYFQIRHTSSKASSGASGRLTVVEVKKALKSLGQKKGRGV